MLEEAATWVRLSAEAPRRDGGVPVSHWSVKYELADSVRGHSSSRLFTNGELRTFHNSYCFAGPAAWNSLPSSVQELTDTTAFKHQLKTVRYDTIRYDSGYLTCSKKLTCSQLSLPYGINRKLKCETKNKMMSVISPVRSRYREAVQ